VRPSEGPGSIGPRCQEARHRGGQADRLDHLGGDAEIGRGWIVAIERRLASRRLREAREEITGGLVHDLQRLAALEVAIHDPAMELDRARALVLARELGVRLARISARAVIV
jgi:hypothetical protein